MKRVALMLAVVGVFGWLAATPAWAQDAKQKEKGAKCIAEVAAETGELKTLVTALKAADLVETLKAKGPFTVFAPTDEAFKKLPAGTLDNLLKPENKKQLASLLTYHVVPGKHVAADVGKMKDAKTVEGSSLKIETKDGKVTVAGAHVVKADIPCSNGVIHLIDGVVQPKK